MIILLSDKKSDFEKYFTKILCRNGAGIISEDGITEQKSHLNVACLHKQSKIVIDSGIVVLGESLENFKNQNSMCVYLKQIYWIFQKDSQ